MRLDFREEEILKKLNLIADEGFLENVELVDMVEQKVKDSLDYEKEAEALKVQDSPEYREKRENLQKFVDLLSHLYSLFMDHLEGDWHTLSVNVFKGCLTRVIKALKLGSISKIIEPENQDKVIGKFAFLLTRGL